jgi:hypothetical protein
MEYATYEQKITLPLDNKERKKCEKLLRSLEKKRNRLLRKLVKLAFTEQPMDTAAGNAADWR